MDKFIGKRLDGRYEVRELIGVGGMAYVYKAYDCIEDRIVAVKILKEEYLKNEEFTRRFKNESKAIAILSHPNIVKVLDVSFGTNLQYIVMEYIDGITLKEYIEQRKDIHWKEAVHFTTQVLQALQHAHDKGIVHQDIKPQNILLLPDGTIKVTDFGIARFSRSQIYNYTEQSDKAIGSVHYISPEQARAEITDEKSDIYSVGVMLYEMLTGKLPFEADNAVSVAIMQLQSTPKMPREINPEIPEGLEEITIKAMQKDPATRYQSASEMLADIEEFKNNPSIKFEYQYLTDSGPTRFADVIAKNNEESNARRLEEERLEKEKEAKKEKKGPPVLPILAAIAGAFALVALVVVAFVVGKNLIFPSDSGTDSVVVPNLVGKNYNTEVVNDQGVVQNFTITLNEEFNEAAAGTVIKQNPAPGRQIKMKGSLTLTISKGQQLVAIPQVTVGEKRETVKSKLENVGFVVNEIETSSDSVAAGCVIKTDPSYPEQRGKGSTINVYVSSGAEPVAEVQVPNVLNTAQADAISTLKAKGLVVNADNIQTQNNALYAAGMVISQSPEAGTSVPSGTEVKLVVSSGYKDVSVTVAMPSYSQPVDLQVYLNGQYSERYSADLKGLLPSQLSTVSINFTEQMESYAVLVRIAPSGGAFSDYAEYQVDGKKGTFVQTGSYPFNPPVKTTRAAG